MSRETMLACIVVGCVIGAMLCSLIDHVIILNKKRRSGNRPWRDEDPPDNQL